MSDSNLFTNGVKSWQNLKVNSLEVVEPLDIKIQELETDTLIKIQRPVAFNVGEEYSQFSFEVLGVGNVWTDWTNVITLNTGYLPDYLPPAVGDKIDINESGGGVYSSSVRILNNSALGNSQRISMEYVNDSNIRFMAGSEWTGNDTPAIGELWMTETNLEYFDGALSDKFRVRMKYDGVGTANFQGILTVVRLK